MTRPPFPKKIVALITLIVISASSQAIADVSSYVPGTAANTGGVVLVTESTLPGTGDASKTYRITNATNGTDCAAGTPGTARADCRWTGSGYEPVGVAATGLTNPLVSTLDAATQAITNPGLIGGRNVVTDGTKLDANKVYYCDLYAGGDIGAKCNAAYAAALADGSRGAIIDAGRGLSTQTTKFDACDETGQGQWIPFTLRGMGPDAVSSREGTRWTAGAGLATSNVSRTNYSITANVDGLGRDQIDCVGCNFISAGIRRGDLIETTSFASSSSNYNRTNSASSDTRRIPLKVYRVSTTSMIVEDEENAGPGLANVTADTGGQVRKLASQIDVCHSNQYIESIELDGDVTNNYADIGIHRKMDNVTTDACTGSTTPYPGCTGVGTGTGMGINNSIGGGERRVQVANHKYFDIAVTAPATGGQNDEYRIDDSGVGDGTPIAIWMDDEQAEPGPVIAGTQIANYKRNGVRVGAGNVFLRDYTVVSGHSDCTSDTYGRCVALELRTSSTTGISADTGSIEAYSHEALVVGTQISGPRRVSIRNSAINALGVTLHNLVDAPAFCGTFENSGNLWINYRTITTPAKLIVATTAPDTCPLKILGESSYHSFQTGYPAPELTPGITTITDSSLPPVDTRTAPGTSDHLGEYEEKYFAIDGVKNLSCTDSFSTGGPPQTSGSSDGLCDNDGVTRYGKSKVYGRERLVVNQTQAEGYGDRVVIVAGGDTDAVGRETYVHAPGGCKDLGDECAQDLRNFITDSYYKSQGTLVGSIAAGSGNVTVSVANVLKASGAGFGEGRLMVFESNASAGAVAELVDLTSVPAGTLDTNPTPTYAAGTWSTPGNKTWGINPASVAGGSIATAGFGAGWALCPTNATFTDAGNLSTRECFKIVSCNSGANTCDTEWLAQGVNYGVPYGTLAEVGTDEALIAPAVEIVKPLYNVGVDRIPDQVIVSRPSGFDGTSNNAAFVIPDYPGHALYGAQFIVGRRHGSTQPHIGINIENDTTQGWGAHQGNAGVVIDGTADASVLVEGVEHHWLSGFRCYPGAAESCLRADFKDEAIGQQVILIDFPASFPNNTWMIMRPVENHENSLSFDLDNGLWGAGYTSFEPFLRTSLTNPSINSGFPNGSGSKVHWSQLLGVPAGFADNSDDGGGAGGDPILIGGSNVTDGLGVDFYVTPGILGTYVSGTTPDQYIISLDYSQTLAGNPAFSSEVCAFTNDGTSGGGFLCEGNVGGANNNEQLHLFGAADGADTTDFIATAPTAVTDALSAATAASSYQPLATSLTRLNANCTIENDGTPIPDSCVGDGTDGGGGGGTAAGSDTQVQFNDGGTAFGGDSGLVFNKTTNIVTAGGYDSPADATNGGSVVIKEGADDGSNSLTIKVPDSGLSSSVTHTVGSNGKFPANAISQTFTECFPIYSPTAGILDTDDIATLWRAPQAITITELWCETDTGTVTADLQIDDGSPADIMGTDLVCDSSSEVDNTGLTGSMADGDRLDLLITSVASSPKRLTFCAEYTVN